MFKTVKQAVAKKIKEEGIENSNGDKYIEFKDYYILLWCDKFTMWCTKEENFKTLHGLIELKDFNELAEWLGCREVWLSIWESFSAAEHMWEVEEVCDSKELAMTVIACESKNFADAHSNRDFDIYYGETVPDEFKITDNDILIIEKETGYYEHFWVEKRFLYKI